MATASSLRATQKQWKKVNAQLTAAEARVSNEMKLRIALALKCTTRTIETYLAGHGRKLSFAEALAVQVEAELKSMKAAA